MKGTAMTGSGSRLGAHFVYQRVRVEDGRVARLGDHLRLAERALKSVYGIDTQLDAAAVAALVASEAPPKQTTAALLIFPPDEPPRIETERPLLTRGYSHSPLRPVGVTFCYSTPYAGWPTSVGLAATALLDDLARRQTGATARSIRRDGDRLIACGDAALFGIRGRKIFTAPIEDGAMESIERQAVMDAARAAGSRLEPIEEAVPHTLLREFDELFFADAAGITSLAECDGAKLSALIAAKLATTIANATGQR